MIDMETAQALWDWLFNPKGVNKEDTGSGAPPTAVPTPPAEQIPTADPSQIGSSRALMDFYPPQRHSRSPRK
jgi:hypothetical protein